jgi:hypothetical protein
MQFTKQDIKKISQQLAKAAVKDSQFREITAEEIKENTAVPLVIEGTSGKENTRINAEEFIRFLSEHLDLDQTKLTIDGTEYSLLGILKQLLHIESPEDPELPYQISSGAVGYINVETLGTGAKSVQAVLDIILSILYGHDKENKPVSFPTAAESTDITNILTAEE